MAVDSSWNINEYHNKFEPNEHWELKQEFILAHKEIIPEDRLVSLAQVYVNMELLGCRYPGPVAMQVKVLAKGLGANYRDSRQNKLQRTFVKASDAVLAKLRKEDPVTSKERNSAVLNREEDTTTSKTTFQPAFISQSISEDKNSVLLKPQPTQSSQSAKRVPIVFDLQTDKSPSNYGSKGPGQWSATRGAPRQAGLIRQPVHAANSYQGNDGFQNKFNPTPSVPKYVIPSRRRDVQNKFNPTPSVPKYVIPSRRRDGLDQDKLNTYLSASNRGMDLSHAENLDAIISVWSSDDPLAKLILINRSYSSTLTASLILSHSIEACGMSYTVDPNLQDQTYVAYMNNTPLESVSMSVGLKPAKEQLALAVLEDLCQHCCLLEIKKQHCANSQQIQTDEIEEDQSLATQGGSQAITNDNIGNKMLKMMGWTGGGLGKDGTGRAEPIEPSMMCGREGLGYTGPHGGGLVTPEFKKKTVILIRNFIKDVENGISETGELLFSPKFSKEQRAFIHSTARRFRLKSTSYGKDSARYLVLSLKLTVHQKLLQALKDGSSNDTFAVYLPGTYDLSIFNLITS